MNALHTIHVAIETLLRNKVRSFLTLLGVMMGFGLYPARKASLLDPIEALRYE